MAKILAFAGSARKESLNKKLLKIVAAGAEDAGAHLTLVDLSGFEMPLFSQDLESEQDSMMLARPPATRIVQTITTRIPLVSVPRP